MRDASEIRTHAGYDPHQGFQDLSINHSGIASGENMDPNGQRVEDFLKTDIIGSPTDIIG
jgi:hypothetical protein